ncbi:single-stranded DNA-binding protein [Burkholderia sp. Ac-20384]|uniref:ERF family protein n=1 Tax=Burkholderia sp. Ac-20384 TaxID=2703902 RepID=UPI0019820A13|nr:ERF family protein [Burkholderia sp. Ac-20384]MBN3822309.1 single-stranded DNA-binding protein [Burkholderia sp. Ac-20384]
MEPNLKVYGAIAAVMQEMSQVGISKDRRNQQQGYNFRGIDDAYAALSPALSKNKLLMLPRVTKREQVERTTAKGSAIFYTTVTVEFDLISAEDGSKHTIVTVGEAMDSADKSSNKAMSAAYKYAAFQAFCIPTEGDNDADAHTHDVAARKSERTTGPAPLSDSELTDCLLALTEASDIEVLQGIFGAAWKRASKEQRPKLKKKYDERMNALTETAAA